MPAKLRKRIGQLNIQRLFEHFANHDLGAILHVLLLHEGHFDIELSELRLTVCAQVFITEAARNLVIAVHARHHQELFEQLW